MTPSILKLEGKVTKGEIHNKAGLHSYIPHLAPTDEGQTLVCKAYSVYALVL